MSFAITFFTPSSSFMYLIVLSPLADRASTMVDPSNLLPPILVHNYLIFWVGWWIPAWPRRKNPDWRLGQGCKKPSFQQSSPQYFSGGIWCIFWHCPQQRERYYSSALGSWVCLSPFWYECDNIRVVFFYNSTKKKLIGGVGGRNWELFWELAFKLRCKIYGKGCHESSYESYRMPKLIWDYLIPGYFLFLLDLFSSSSSSSSGLSNSSCYYGCFSKRLLYSSALWPSKLPLLVNEWLFSLYSWSFSISCSFNLMTSSS